MFEGADIVFDEFDFALFGDTALALLIGWLFFVAEMKSSESGWHYGLDGDLFH